MFGRSRRQLECLEAIANALQAISENLKAGLDLMVPDRASGNRLEALELSRAKWEAEIDARLLKADSTLRSASNAESRARTMEKHVEKLTGEGPPDGPPPIPPESIEIHGGDGHPVETSEVQPVSVGVEESPKNQRLRAKFAIGGRE